MVSSTRNLKNVLTHFLSRALFEGFSRLKTFKMVSEAIAHNSRTEPDENTILNELESTELNKLKESL
jgi:hypothetical protein